MVPKPLTQAEVDKLTDGSQILVVWRGKDSERYEPYVSKGVPTQYRVRRTTDGAIVACRLRKKNHDKPITFLSNVNEPDGPVVYALEVPF